jgi:hypothetical protein
MYTITVYTDSTLKIERTESATAEAKHDQYEQWYARVNSECNCNTTEKCGDKYRCLVQKITAEGATSNAQLRNNLNAVITTLSKCWPSGSKHFRKLSATCDHALMPRELLPRLGSRSTVSPDKWPYLSQTTIDDVRAMRFIRSAYSTRPVNIKWATLQQRLEQHATTGAGTVAEAILVNDYWWLGQVAHEPPSGGKSKARRRRNNKT